MLYSQGKTTIYYEKRGNKKNTILILPGWGETRMTFTQILEEFSPYFTIYILDYPFFGESPPLEEEWTIYDYANLIKDFLKDKKINNPIVIAHSFGGRIVSILQGKENIPIKKIILIDVAGIKRNRIKRWIKTKYYKIIKFFLRRNPRLLDIWEERHSSEDYKSLPTTMKKTFQNIIKEDLKKYYKRIQSETLILWGENDKDTPLKDAYLLRRIIKNSGFVIFKNSTHFSYLENANQTIIILKEFLKKDMD